MITVYNGGIAGVFRLEFAVARHRTSYPAPFLENQGPWTVVQVTVSKRLTFWHSSSTAYGVGKVADKLLMKSGLTD